MRCNEGPILVVRLVARDSKKAFTCKLKTIFSADFIAFIYFPKHVSSFLRLILWVQKMQVQRCLHENLLNFIDDSLAQILGGVSSSLHCNSALHGRHPRSSDLWLVPSLICIDWPPIITGIAAPIGKTSDHFSLNIASDAKNSCPARTLLNEVLFDGNNNRIFLYHQHNSTLEDGCNICLTFLTSNYSESVQSCLLCVYILKSRKLALLVLFYNWSIVGVFLDALASLDFKLSVSQ